MVSKHTAVLFKRPSMLEGFARLFDFAGALDNYNTSPTPREADKKAIESDWAAVGEDMWAALARAEQLLERQKDSQ